MNTDYASEIPTGWRLLDSNESIERGDQYWNEFEGKFMPIKYNPNLNRAVSDTSFTKLALQGRVETKEKPIQMTTNLKFALAIMLLVGCKKEPDFIAGPLKNGTNKFPTMEQTPLVSEQDGVATGQEWLGCVSFHASTNPFTTNLFIAKLDVETVIAVSNGWIKANFHQIYPYLDGADVILEVPLQTFKKQQRLK